MHLNSFSCHQHPSTEGLERTASGFPGATVTKYHTVGSLNNRNVFPHSSRGYKSKIKVSAGLVASQG